MTTSTVKSAIILCCTLLLLGLCAGIPLHAQPSGSWAVRSYETLQDTLQRWYSITNLTFADTSLGLAYWRYNNTDSLRGSGWRQTTDGGITWYRFSVVGLDNFQGRFALRGPHGVNVQISGSGAVIPYLTSDSGHTWSAPPLPGSGVYEIIADELRPTEAEGIQNLAALQGVGDPFGRKRLTVTTDGGLSWHRLDSILFVGLDDSVRLRYSVLDLHWLRDTVLTLMTGVMDTTMYVGYNPEIWEVGIGGTVLRRISLPKELAILQYNPGTGSTRSIRFSDSVWMFLYRWSSVNQLSLTSDAGRTWKTVPQTQPFPYSTFHLTPTLQIRGNSISLDTGLTSRVWASPYGVNGLIVLDSLHWITSMGSVVAHTTDAGHTWNFKSGYRPITAMQVAGGTILLTSPLHRMLRSRDRGETFEDVTDGLPPGVTTFSALCVRDPDEPGKLAAVARDASFEMGVRQVLLHSDDAGRTWGIVRDLASLGRGNVTNIQFVRRSDVPGSVAGWLTSDSGMSITTDGGATWTSRTHRRGAITMIDERIGWTAVDTLILRTTDGTVTWDTSYRLPFFYRNLQAFKAFDSLRAVALLPNVLTPPTWKIARTSNGGRTWDTMGSSHVFAYNVGRYIWVNSSTLYLTDSGKMWLSRNSGVSFIVETRDTSGWSGGVLDGRSIYFFGKGGIGRWDITDPGISDVPAPHVAIAGNDRLKIDAVRNGVVVRLAPNDEEYRLDIHDVTGGLVQSRQLRRGETAARVENLTVGWYSVRLVSRTNVVVGGSVVVMP